MWSQPQRPELSSGTQPSDAEHAGKAEAAVDGALWAAIKKPADDVGRQFGNRVRARSPRRTEKFSDFNVWKGGRVV
jgi:hypothetical protein